jgi:outer membrane murein-binding lipoprotein Lpp
VSALGRPPVNTTVLPIAGGRHRDRSAEQRVALPQWRPMTQRLRLLILSVLAAATIAAGCGDEVDELNERVDEAQQQVRDAQREVDQAREALEDPAGAATDEARRRLEEAERELREAQQAQ